MKGEQNDAYFQLGGDKEKDTMEPAMLMTHSFYHQSITKGTASEWRGRGARAHDSHEYLGWGRKSKDRLPESTKDPADGGTGVSGIALTTDWVTFSYRDGVRVSGQLCYLR